jgi:hypothetical protein
MFIRKFAVPIQTGVPHRRVSKDFPVVRQDSANGNVRKREGFFDSAGGHDIVVVEEKDAGLGGKHGTIRIQEVFEAVNL